MATKSPEVERIDRIYKLIGIGFIVLAGASELLQQTMGIGRVDIFTGIEIGLTFAAIGVIGLSLTN